MDIITTSVIKSTLRFIPKVQSKPESLNTPKNCILNESLSSKEKTELEIPELINKNVKEIYKKKGLEIEKKDNLNEIKILNVNELYNPSKSDLLESEIKKETSLECENKTPIKMYKNEETHHESVMFIDNKCLKKNSELDYSKSSEDQNDNKNLQKWSISSHPTQEISKKKKLEMTKLNQNVKEFKKLKRKRSVSPVNGEKLKIEPTEIKISDLCKDIRIGRKSVKFNEIRKMGALKKKMRSKNSDSLPEKVFVNQDSDITVKNTLSFDKLEQKTCINTHNLKSSISKNENISTTKYNSRGAPQVRLVNGKIVINEISLQVDRHERDVNPDTEMELIEENDLSRKALSQWGTDFGLICKMFPNRSQRQIKNKFNSEERKYPEKIDIAIRSRKPIDIAAYSKATGSNFRSIDEIEEELRKMKEDFEESRRISIENAQYLVKNKNN
ncbi:hypothetical protein PCANB_001157 [Pneumocystis canis]|nr:hypothetical protein PCANB_001157 [Pneumocystis canis]